jgi:hypothetical protein
LLVVMAILGILVGMLLVAVQKAREAACRASRSCALGKNSIDFPGFPAAGRADSSGFYVVEERRRPCSEDLAS